MGKPGPSQVVLRYSGGRALCCALRWRCMVVNSGLFSRRTSYIARSLSTATWPENIVGEEPWYITAIPNRTISLNMSFCGDTFSFSRFPKSRSIFTHSTILAAHPYSRASNRDYTLADLTNLYKKYKQHHHLHHHIHEGLGVFPVPWSPGWSSSLHLFLGRPMFLRPFGLYCSACFGSLFVSILCTCCSHSFWYCFISSTMFCAPFFLPMY